MTLSEVIARTGVQRLEVAKVLKLDEETNEKIPTGWLRHWDNDNRVAVSVHQDVFDFMKDKEARKTASFGLQYEERTSSESGEKYDSYRIVRYESIEVLSLID